MMSNQAFNATLRNQQAMMETMAGLIHQVAPLNSNPTMMGREQPVTGTRQGTPFNRPLRDRIGLGGAPGRRHIRNRNRHDGQDRNALDTELN
jgi:hypothetical protein